jgi:dipeptidyl aminopeptidase/acylaminoacyl peptidase
MVRLLEGPYLTDQLAALKWYRQQPFVDAEQIFVIGSSLGGIQALLIAAETSQIKASVSFAAAALSWSDSAPLRESMLSAASAAKVPIMFIQAENDADTTPSRALAATMAAAGKPHRLKIFPKFGETTQDGHNFGYFGSQVWEQDLFDFFNEQINYTSIKRSIRHQFEGGERVGERQSK